MQNYLPYKSDKSNKKYFIMTKDNKNIYILVHLATVILLFIKMKQENKDI